MKKIVICFICFVIFQTGYSQMVGKYEKGPFLLKGATIHPITSPSYVGDVFIQGDRIQSMGENVSTFAPVTTIDCTGKHIYPGFIDAGTHLGLGEVGAVSLTNDYNEIGEFIPQMQALTAVNPNSVSIPVSRTNGVTTVFTYPSGGGISGTGALIDLVGYTPEQMYAGSKGVIMYFPSSGKRGWWDRRKPDEIKKESKKKMDRLNELWDNAFLYAKIDSNATARGVERQGYRPELEALMPVIQRETKLFIEVNKAEDIINAIKWIADRNLDAILTGVSEGFRVADEIAASKLPVIVGPVLNMPPRASDRFDKAYANAGILMKSGVLVAIRTNETENVRNLPFNAGFAANYGMGIDEALKAVTINSAKVFGVDKHYGSLEEGKIANLFVCDGDPFETKTQISNLFIKGIKVPLENRHTLLYDEFLDRTPGLMKE